MRLYILAAIPIILSVGLLVALRVNEPKQSPAMQLGGSEVIRRGEDMHTGPGEMKAFEVNGATLYLAENTTVTLVDSSSTPKVALREGRIVTSGLVDISVRETVVHADSKTTFVFYAWLDKLDVSVLDGVTPGYSINTLTDTTDPTPLPVFHEAASAAKDFYAWVNKN
jgi:hypothetical protein